MADDIFTKDLITYDPLSETTRKERTSLLGLSMLGVALVKVPLVPEKFSALGVDFSHVNQAAFVHLYAVVVIYYLVAFGLYSVTDYIAWRRMEVIQLSEYQRQHKERLADKPVNLDELLDEQIAKQVQGARVGPRPSRPAYAGGTSYWFGWGAARVRASFEFLLPILFGAYTLWVLFHYVPVKP